LFSFFFCFFFEKKKMLKWKSKEERGMMKKDLRNKKGERGNINKSSNQPLKSMFDEVEKVLRGLEKVAGRKEREKLL